jgi:hypothetical protein
VIRAVATLIEDASVNVIVDEITKGVLTDTGESFHQTLGSTVYLVFNLRISVNKIGSMKVG